MLNYGVTFNLGFATICSPAIFETHFSYHKNIWIAATDYCICSPQNFTIQVHQIRGKGCLPLSVLFKLGRVLIMNYHKAQMISYAV